MTRDNHSVIQYFLEPRSLALIGISRKTGRGAFNIMESLIQYGYEGELYPVNPNAEEILGRKVYPDVGSLPKGIDVAIITTPRELVPQLVRACAGRDIKGVIIVTQGFLEADDHLGKDLQHQLDQIVRETGIRILGPNSVGVVNAFAGFSTVFFPIPRTCVPVALISQSGGFFEGFSSCPFGKGVDVGNTSDISFIEALSFFEQDPDTRVIVLYLEALNAVAAFIPLAKRVARSKPIVVLRGGKSKRGKMEAVSHTGSLVGEDGFYEAVFRKGNLIAADSASELGDIIKAYLSLPSFTGDRVAIVTPSGAGGILGLDAVELQGFRPAELLPETTKKIDAFFPSWLQVKSPVDILSAGMAHGYKKVYQLTLEACLADPGVDAVLAICGTYTIRSIKQVVSKHPDKPVVAWVLGHDESAANEIAQEVNFHPHYPSPERALGALRALRKYYQGQDGGREKKKTAPLLSAEAHQTIREAETAKEPLLGLSALKFLESCAFPIVPTREVGSLSQALETAEEINYPVVLKVESSSVVHKSEAGGVLTNLYSPEVLTHAFKELWEKFRPGDLDLDARLLMQPMVSGGEEVILGLKRDPQFGAVLMYGMGGIYTEVLKDVSFRLAPLSREEALQMIEETRTSSFYQELRGRPPLDRNGVIESLLRLSEIAEAFPSIHELDINPLVVLPEGVKVVDARIILGKLP
jgi:acyl-CoA synthetase (NDP forming)